MDEFIRIITTGNLIGIFIKLFGIALSLFYVAFAFIILRQISTLEKAIEINDRGLLPLAGYIQLILSFILVGYSVLIL